MKLSIVASTAALLALTALPFGQATTPSLRSSVGEEQQELEVVLKVRLCHDGRQCLVGV